VELPNQLAGLLAQALSASGYTRPDHAARPSSMKNTRTDLPGHGLDRKKSQASICWR